MGHYDDTYEHDEEERRKLYNNNCKEASKKLSSFRQCLPHKIPKRFIDQLDDLENWLYRQGN